MNLLDMALGMGIANAIAEDEKKKRERNIIEIPENATNGDVLKVVFEEIALAEKHIKHINIRVDGNWWNAPYRRETE